MRRGDYNAAVPLTPDAADHLTWDNPVLLDLIARYDKVDSPLNSHSQWKDDYRSDLHLPYFRGDNCYVRQVTNFAGRLASSLSRYAGYLHGIDDRRLLGRLVEDGAFGCWAFDHGNGMKISRDLLDSVNELSFLARAWDLFDRSDVTVIDIGAGYGRLAHRMVEAFDGIDRYYCVDAVPESTFVCSYYLDHRGVSDRAVTIPLDRLDEIDGTRIDLAVNIHSFSEMPYSAIEAWLNWLAVRRVENLFIVSNTQDRMFSREPDGGTRDVAPLLRAHGYHRVRSELIIDDAPTCAGLGVDDHFMLYQLRK
nr:methyltransferase [Streptomyces sp.]